MSTIPTQVRLPENLHSRLVAAAEKMSLPISDVIRQAIALGIQDLALVNFDVDKVLHEAVLEARRTLQKDLPKK